MAWVLPAPYSIMNKLTLAFFPTAATKIRNLPPVHIEDLGQTMLKTADPVFPSMSPTVITRTGPGTFHEFPPSHVTLQDCSCLSEQRVQPNHTQPPTLCATRTEDSVCILTHEQRVSLYETNPSTKRPGISVHPACNEATCFLGTKGAAEPLSTESSNPNPTRHMEQPWSRTF